MKFNWGTGIFLFYTFFACSLFYTVYRSTQYDHSLVVENYYEKDLAYQSTLDKLNNSNSLKTPLKIEFIRELRLVELDFPDQFKDIQGTVFFYRANNKKEDLLFDINTSTDRCMNIFVRTLQPGKWKVEVDWTGDRKPFLDREIIIVPDYEQDELLTK